jgi:hypothetical protein
MVHVLVRDSVERNTEENGLSCAYRRDCLDGQDGSYSLACRGVLNPVPWILMHLPFLHVDLKHAPWSSWQFIEHRALACFSTQRNHFRSVPFHCLSCA